MSDETMRLDACPMCGMTESADNATQEAGLVVRVFSSPAGGMACQVECACGVRGPSARETWRAAEKWNRRSTPSTRDEVGPVAGEVKPDAWLLDHPEHGEGLSFGALTDGDRLAGFTSRPLYAAPPPRQDDALRIAVEALKEIEDLPAAGTPEHIAAAIASESLNSLSALKSTAAQEESSK